MCVVIYEEMIMLKNSMHNDISTSSSKSRIDSQNDLLIEQECPHSKCALKDLREQMTVEAQNQEYCMELLGAFLQASIDRNDGHKPQGQRISRFHGKSVVFSASYYVERIAKFSGCSPCCFVAALVYLDRIFRQLPDLCLNSRTLQRLVLVAVMEAAKYLEDEPCGSQRWAKIGELTLQELYMLELDFLGALGFNLWIYREEYDRFAATLRSCGKSQPSASAWDRHAVTRRPRIFAPTCERHGCQAVWKAANATNNLQAIAAAGTVGCPAPCGPSSPSPP